MAGPLRNRAFLPWLPTCPGGVFVLKIAAFHLALALEDKAIQVVANQPPSAGPACVHASTWPWWLQWHVQVVTPVSLTAAVQEAEHDDTLLSEDTQSEQQWRVTTSWAAWPGPVSHVSLSPAGNTEYAGSQHTEAEVLLVWAVNLFAVRVVGPPFCAWPKRSFWAKHKEQGKKAMRYCVQLSEQFCPQGCGLDLLFLPEFWTG